MNDIEEKLALNLILKKYNWRIRGLLLHFSDAKKIIRLLCFLSIYEEELKSKENFLLEFDLFL